MTFHHVLITVSRCKLCCAVLSAPKLGAGGDINVGGRRFRLIATEKTWDNAQAYCKSLGANLATTDTEEIGDTLVEAYRQAQLPAGATGGFWIGLRTTDGEFTTCPWSYNWISTGKPQDLNVYYCWRTIKVGGRKLLGMPTGTGGCVNAKRYDPAPNHFMYGAGLWVGWPCDSTLAPFFCEL